MGWTGFTAIIAGFFLTHSIPLRPIVKGWLTALLGRRGFGWAYSALSLAMLAVLIRAAGEAPYLPLWSPMPWQRHLAHLGMLAVCLILAFSIARPNPFSFGGARNDSFDATRAGIVRWTRHPILLALALWAGVHMLVNGDLAHVALFGLLGGFAIAGPALIDRRNRRETGLSDWAARNTARRAAPLFQRPLSLRGAVLRGLAGLIAFAVLILAHPYVIGVPAL